MPGRDPLSTLRDSASAGFDGLAQAHRLLRLHTPLGPDRLFAEDLELWEGIGPATGPALGDEPFGRFGMGADGSRPWASDAPLGPARAGLRLVVHALVEDAHLELKLLIGQPALVEMLCQDSRTELRPWHGHVVTAAMLGSDGGLARLRLVIEPWLAVLAHRVDARVFQDASVPRIIDTVFSAHDGQGRLVPAWRWELADAGVYPRRSLCVQYHESDLDFVLRLMREEGLFCWWEHTGDAESAHLGIHTLVVADHNGALRPNRQAVVRFTGSDHTLGEDSLTRWTTLATVTSARVAMRSHDHRGLGARPVEAGVAGSVVPPMPELAIVDVPGAYACEDMAQGQRLTTRQAEALAAVRARALARGPWRRAEAGTSFTLVDHPRHDGGDAGRDEFVVLAAQHRARNHFFAHEQARLARLDRACSPDGGTPRRSARDDATPLHEAALLLQPRRVPVRFGTADATPPAPPSDGRFGVLGPRHERQVDPSPSLFDARAVASIGPPDVRLNLRPTVRGTQTAIVVGDPGGDLHTDRDGRIRVQFHWQRGSRSSHRLAAREGADDAPATAASFTWVRVGQSLAGANFGAVFTPRIGQEVVLAFTGGDIDRPVVIGAVYNGQGLADAQGNRVATGAAQATGNAPAWFAGQQPAGQHEGHRHGAVLLGHKSQELGTSRTGTGGFNQLVFDDSAGANRIELSTTMQSSGLQLGALLQQQDNQRLAPRGHGLALESAAHGAIRAGAGLLVSAHSQPASTATGQQLEAETPRAVLQAAQGLVHVLAESAQAHRAMLACEPSVAGAHAADLAHRLPAEQGLHALHDSLSGRDGTSPSGMANAGNPTGATPGGFGSVAAWKRPDLVLAAPAGIGLFTPQTAVVSAGSHVTLSAGQDVHSIAQGRQATVAKSGVVVYTVGRATDATKPTAETGIALHAATGSVRAVSHTGAARLTASGPVDVTSTQAGVRIVSPTRVLLTAAGAAIRLGGGDITISAPGAVTFQAGMKVLTGPGSASEQFQRSHGGKVGPLDFNEVFVVTNDAGAPLANRRYEITREDGAILRGTTGADGRIEQQLSFKGERVKVSVKGKA